VEHEEVPPVDPKPKFSTIFVILKDPGADAIKKIYS